MRADRTLRSPVRVEGHGLHSGSPVAAVLAPAAPGSGVVFVAGGVEIPADLTHAVAEPGATVLTAGGVRVGVVEHLLAALAGLGITDLRVEVSGDELPFGDGSALPWVEAVDRVGRTEPGAVRGRALSTWTATEAHGGRAAVGPGDTVSVDVRFPGGPCGRLAVRRTEAAFRAEVAWARTFVRAGDVERLRATGRGRGATPENTVVWPTAPMRSPDECVRHKLLDAWGDLALLGRGRFAFAVERGSHRLHLEALRAAAFDGPDP